MATMRAKQGGRRGLATLEMALVLPFLLLLIFGIIEFSWLFLKANQVTQITREAARTAVLPASTSATVTAQVTAAMTSIGITTYTLTLNPPDITTAPLGGVVTVQINVPYSSLTGATKLLATSAGTSILPSKIDVKVAMARESGL